jgi:hypothetical protein
MATLLEVRTQFAKLSGRYDLVDGSFADNGADYYLKAGIKFLDRRIDFDQDTAKAFLTLTAGQWFKSFASLRSVSRVWFADSTNGRSELDYLTPSELQTLYGTKAYADVDSGTPVYFTVDILRSFPDGSALDVIGNYGSELEVDGSQLGKTGIIIMPPTELAGQLEVWGKFETPWPSADSETNWWFDKFETTAVNAALYKLEVSYRNTVGANDWLSAIELDLLGIQKDAISTDVNYSDQMEG